MMWLLEVAIVPLFVGAPGFYTTAKPYAQFTSGVNLVEVYATVTDRQGEPVAGLTAADFRIAEDGAAQAISTFAAGEFPLAVAVGLDRSFSMGGRDNRLGVAKSAARTFVGALRPDDQVMIVAIGGETTIAAGSRPAMRLRWRQSIGSMRGARRRSMTRRSARSTPFSRPADAGRWCCCRMAPIGTATRRPRSWWIARGATTC
jgi:hypothetical protein